MKKLLFAALATIAFHGANAQKEISAGIKNVTVYPNNALIEKSAVVNLTAGNNILYLKGNSPYLDPNSIRFDADDKYEIVYFSSTKRISSINPEYENTLPEQVRIKYKGVKDSIEGLNREMERLVFYNEVLNKETASLNNMKVMSNPQNTDSLANIRNTLNYYREKMLEINKIRKQNEDTINALKKQLERLVQTCGIIESSYPDKQNPENNKEYFVKVNIFATQAVNNAELNYSYLCNNVGWTPAYDLKINSQDNSGELILKANLYQNTCENWKDVNLTFSTENNNAYMYNGELYPYYLSLQIPIKKTSKVIHYEMPECDMVLSGSPSVRNAAYNTVISNSMLGKEYTVARKRSIPSEETIKTINIRSQQPELIYRYSIKPVLSSRAFFQGLVPNWQQLELMDADVNLYFDGKYTNKTHIYSNSVQEDTLCLDLGVDRRISVERKINKSVPNKTSIVGNQLEMIVEVDIKVKNNSLKEMDAAIEDRIPLTTSPDIKISVLDIDGAQMDEKTGFLKWTKKIKASETVNLKVKYSVRYPKDHTLNEIR